MKILLVDDSPIVRMVLAGRLEALGHEVFAVDGGERALEHLARDACDLILTDVQMPGIDGIELTRRLRAGEATRDIPIVLVSESQIAFKELGADDLITKAIRDDDLNARLHALSCSRKMP